MDMKQAIEIINNTPKEQIIKVAKAIENLRWIPVSERLPTEKDADTETGLVLYKQSNGWMFTDYWFVAEMGKSAITHWMPLPKPQEVKE